MLSMMLSMAACTAAQQNSHRLMQCKEHAHRAQLGVLGSEVLHVRFQRAFHSLGAAFVALATWNGIDMFDVAPLMARQVANEAHLQQPLLKILSSSPCKCTIAG